MKQPHQPGSEPDGHSVASPGRRAFFTRAAGVTAGLIGLAVAVPGRAHASPAAPAAGTAQSDWWFCQKCYTMFFHGYADNGRCPAGGAHSPQGYNFILPYGGAATPTAQSYWRFCPKCYSMHFEYYGPGPCPAGGGHIEQGFVFVLPHDIPATLTSQSDWRFCQKCFVMFFYGYADNGHCAAGGAHSAQGFDFVLPHA
ncbi:hypothetical protein [Actinacidiphila acididurans]|uniref:Uncharacterized protein n=1 Tax=Actinacidiphila acididurans TaxID=2784346 RepID=A0ABS2TTI5_9ACTN|nr:hypothetical protein [Actinacidiphila acididurans]MBM9506649.1 hypothetical protein [Actinacidiphila acididurans]